MENIILKDGTEANIEIWNYKDLDIYVSSQKMKSDEKWKYHHVKGFRYLSEIAVQNLLYRGEPFFNGKNVSEMEKQDISRLPKENYTRALAALCDEELIGIMVCNWVRDNNCEKSRYLGINQLPFWRYFVEFLNVHEDYHNKGVGSELIKKLDDSKFLNNKILQLSIYNEDGDRFARPIIEKKLNARKYALIPHNYSVDLPPTKPGVYDRLGNLKKR